MVSLGSYKELTTAQIMFLSLSAMETAKVVSGNGMVERPDISAPKTEDDMHTNRKVMSVQEYAEMRRREAEIAEVMKRKREEQKELREAIEKQVLEMVMQSEKEKWRRSVR